MVLHNPDQLMIYGLFYGCDKQSLYIYWQTSDMSEVKLGGAPQVWLALVTEFLLFLASDFSVLPLFWIPHNGDVHPLLPYFL